MGLSVWFFAGFLALPAVTLVHECAHLLIGYLFHWPGQALHYASVTSSRAEEFQRLVDAGSFASAAKIHPLRQVGLVNIAGPAVSILILLGTAIWTRKRGPRPFAIAFGFSAASRFVAPLATGGVLLFRWLLSIRGPFRPTIDEYGCGLLLGLSPAIVILLSLGVASCCLFWLLASVCRRELRWPLVTVVTGVAASAVAYFCLLGPLLLP